jgi:hypothetical protein
MENKFFETNKQKQNINFVGSGSYHWNASKQEWEKEESEFEYERRGIIKFFDASMVHEVKIKR